MTTIIQKLTKFFEIKEQSRLEQYINSKHPTNAAEVEYWTKQYENNNDGLYWSRGL
jgi:5-methylcytosine-specific restriction endonuclease McrBC regulatory subunit McrC